MKVFRYVVWFTVGIALAAPAGAQQLAPDSSCTYQTCALRIESNWSGTRIVRGAEGERVATIGTYATRPRLSRVVARSDRAVDFARIYERKTVPGQLLVLAGTALALVPELAEAQTSEGAKIALYAGAIGLTLYGGITLGEAQRALSRALWWYNGSLPR